VLTFMALFPWNELKTFPWDRMIEILILKVHKISKPLKTMLALGDYTVSTPLFQCGFHLATPEAPLREHND
jgi:hypothetical protein